MYPQDRCSKGGSRKEVYSNIDLPQEARKVSHTQPNIIPKGSGKRTANKAKPAEEQKSVIQKLKNKKQYYRLIKLGAGS